MRNTAGRGMTSKKAYQAATKASRTDVQSGKRYSSVITRSPAALISTRKWEGEKKYMDWGDDDEPTTASPIATIQVVNGVAQGPGFFERIGQKLTMKTLHVRVSMYPREPPTDGADHELIRFALVYDRSPNGSEPAIQTIFADYASDGTPVTSIKSGLNPTQTSRFTIIREHWIRLYGINGTAPAGAVASLTDNTGLDFINWYVKLQDLESVYSDADPDITAMVNGAIYLIGWTTAESQAQSALQYSAKTRLRFYG